MTGNTPSNLQPETDTRERSPSLPLASSFYLFCVGLMVRSPKHKHMHEKKTGERCAGYRAELGNQDVRGKRRETNMDNSERDQPTASDD